MKDVSILGLWSTTRLVILPCVLFRGAGWVLHGGNKRIKEREKMPSSLLATANK